MISINSVNFRLPAATDIIVVAYEGKRRDRVRRPCSELDYARPASGGAIGRQCISFVSLCKNSKNTLLCDAKK